MPERRPPREPPAYRRAQDAVMALVRAEGLAPGTLVPSERTLAERLGLSRMTVRQGVQNLVRAGVLARDSTVGTRVANVNVLRVIDSRRAFSMSDMVRGSGARPGSRLLVFAPGRADRIVAERLDLKHDAGIVTIRRLRTADEVPFCVETSILPSALVPGLVADDLTGNASLYRLLHQRYGIEPCDRESEIGAGPIDAEDATLLSVDEGTNMLLYRSIVRGADGRPIESVFSINHPKHVVFTTETVHINIQDGV